MLAVHRAMERQNLIEEVRNLRAALDGRYGFENIVGRSKPLLRVLEQASRVAQHDSTVLIQGETGTGKELTRSRDPSQQPPRIAAVHHDQLRRDPEGPDRIGVVRVHARSIQRRLYRKARQD